MLSTHTHVPVIPVFMDQVTRADRIRAARRHAGLNQEDLARRVGVSEVTIRRLESKTKKHRTKKPDVSLMISVADALGVDVRWLERGEGGGPRSKLDAVEDYLATDEGQRQPESLKAWLRQASPMPGVVPDTEWVRGLVSAYYRGTHDPEAAASHAHLTKLARKNAQKKGGA